MKSLLSLTLIFATAVALLISCKETTESKPPAGGVSQDSLISKGRYMVTTMGCGDCHSPKKFGPMGPQEDSSLYLSGYPASLPLAAIDSAVVKNWVLFNGMQNVTVGPWGISFAANISSDSTGIGNWTEEQFIVALQEGKAKGLKNNRTLLPPMPWQSYSHLHEEDIKAIFAFLKSTKPIKNIVPEPVPPNQLNRKS